MPTSAPVNSALSASPATDGDTPNRVRNAGMAGPYSAWSAPMTTNPPQHPAIAGMVSGPFPPDTDRVPIRRRTVPVCRAGLARPVTQVASPGGRE